jgi:hypothetical protein
MPTPKEMEKLAAEAARRPAAPAAAPDAPLPATSAAEIDSGVGC